MTSKSNKVKTKKNHRINLIDFIIDKLISLFDLKSNHLQREFGQIERVLQFRASTSQTKTMVLHLPERVELSLLLEHELLQRELSANPLEQRPLQRMHQRAGEITTRQRIT